MHDNTCILREIASKILKITPEQKQASTCWLVLLIIYVYQLNGVME